ncbi:uncharacterized protein LOC125036696 isoform X2 [Penaeus chinensis]|uniref:uncharacterized protein LOC125036696 isoform X2 n=1 Tax=Penaeus chinensis TaxID=139456 RepID=UPI001FB7D01C|nr:uncharacterized protein LOC125036696 isoform X2 [Penaeus chinensis]
MAAPKEATFLSDLVLNFVSKECFIVTKMCTVKGRAYMCGKGLLLSKPKSLERELVTLKPDHGNLVLNFVSKECFIVTKMCTVKGRAYMCGKGLLLSKPKSLERELVTLKPDHGNLVLNFVSKECFIVTKAC